MSSSLEIERQEPRRYILLPLMLAAAIALLWLVPLRSSFWVDEMVTAFVVRNGPADPSLAVAPQVAESIYYLLPRAVESLWGISEVGYRLPSVLMMAVALFLVSRLAARLVHPQAAWFAVFACLTLRGVNFEAADARPYALGTCIAAAAFLFLVRWLDSARWTDALLLLLFGALLWRVHLLLWPLYIVLVLYTLVRLMRGETRVGWRYAGAIFALMGFSLLPVLREALALLREAQAHVIVRPPTIRDLEVSLKLGLVAGCGIGAWLFGACRKPAPRASEGAAGAQAITLWPRARLPLPSGVKAPFWATVSLVFGWWLCDPFSLFAYSRWTGNSVFLPRYLAAALPGGALAATLVAGLFIPPGQWRNAALLLALVVLLNPPQWRAPWPRHDNSDWRSAAERINALQLAPETPVISPSPFIEARPPAWRPDYALPGFLYCHLSVYQLQGKPYLFPFETSPVAERYATTLSEETLSASGRFVIYGGDHNVHVWRRWFSGRPELRAWTQRTLGPFGDVDAVVFEKPAQEGK